MQRFLAVFAHWFHLLAFAVWLGGILTLGAIVAPSAFQADRTFAGQVMTASFQKLNTLSFICGAVILAATWVEWRARGEASRTLLFIRAVLVAAALALALYFTLRLLPTMLGMRAPSERAAFDRLHQFSAIIFQVQTFLLLAGAAITSYLAFPRAASEIRAHAGRVSGPRADTPNTEHLNTGAKRP